MKEPPTRKQVGIKGIFSTSLEGYILFESVENFPYIVRACREPTYLKWDEKRTGQ